MNKDYITTPNTAELYDYYWKQIELATVKYGATDTVKKSLQNLANNTYGVKMLSRPMTNELCNMAVYTMLVDVIRSSNDIGYALEFLKISDSNNPEVNRDESSYTNRLISSIRKTLSQSLHLVTKDQQVVDIDKLRATLQTTIDNFYDKCPEYRGASIPVKALQTEVSKVFDSAFGIRKTLHLDKNENMGLQK